MVGRRGMASFKAKFPVLQELFAKNHRGPFGPPPPSEARVNPDPIGIWRVTYPAGCVCGGGESIGPVVTSQTTGPIPKIQTPFDSRVRELSKHGVKFDLEVIDVTGQVKVRMLGLFGLGDIC